MVLRDRQLESYSREDQQSTQELHRFAEERAQHRPRSSAFPSSPYSPNVVEDEFSEIRIKSCIEPTPTGAGAVLSASMLDGQSLHLVVLHKNSDAGKAEESSELGISISLITFGADPDVDYFGDLLAILQREQLPDDPITAAVDGAEALQGSAER